jgi:hypothetical protein
MNNARLVLQVDQSERQWHIRRFKPSFHPNTVLS